MNTAGPKFNPIHERSKNEWCMIKLYRCDIKGERRTISTSYIYILYVNLCDLNSIDVMTLFMILVIINQFYSIFSVKKLIISYIGQNNSNLYKIIFIYHYIFKATAVLGV